MTSDNSQLHVDLESGHYQPETRHMFNAIQGLEKKSVPLAKVTVRPFAKEISKAPKAMAALQFLQELRQLKRGRLKELEKDLQRVKTGELELKALLLRERSHPLHQIVLRRDRSPEAHRQVLDAQRSVS